MTKISQIFNEDLHRNSLKYLLSHEQDEMTLFTKLCKEKADFSDKLKEQIKNSEKALYLCAKNNHLYWLDSFSNEDIFFEKITPDKTLIEFILSNDILLNPSFFENFKKHIEIIDYMEIYCHHKITELSNELLTSLFIPKNGVYLADKYTDDIYEVIYSGRVDADVLLNYCHKKGDYNLFNFVKEDEFLSKLKSGKTLLEELLKIEGIEKDVYFSNISRPESLNILVRNNKFDILAKADYDALCLKYDENNTYLDLLILESKKNGNVKLPTFDVRGLLNKDNLIYVLLTYARNGLMNKIDTLTIGFLLKKVKDGEKSYLEIMLEKDRNLVLKTILPKFKYSVAEVMQLKELGININPSIKLNHHIADEYIGKANSIYYSVSNNKYDDLLNELSSLFNNDHISDSNLIEALVTSYRFSLSRDNPLILKEVKQLIEIKKRFPERFAYVRDSHAYFSSDDGRVHLDKPSIYTINHETSHALHYYLTNFFVPENYYSLVDKLVSNPEFMGKVEDFHKLYRKARESANAKADSEYDNDSRISKLKENLAAEKEVQRSKYLGRYPKEVLDTLLDRTYTVEEYFKQRKKVELSELDCQILNYEFPQILAICDILDAIFEGKIFDCLLKDSTGNTICFPGHGVDYYSFRRKRFFETIAQYGAIRHSPKYGLRLLKEIIGDELFDMIDCFYEQMILNPQLILEGQNENKEAKTL